MCVCAAGGSFSVDDTEEKRFSLLCHPMPAKARRLHTIDPNLGERRIGPGIASVAQPFTC